MRVGMPVYHLVDLLDVAGPFEMLSWAEFDITIAAHHKGRIVCRGGFVIEAETSFDDAPRFDILWVPGGSPESLNERMRDRVFLDFLTQQAEHAKYVCSVCEGALLLAATGMLDGHTITTHWAFEQCFIDRFPKVRLAPDHPSFWLDDKPLPGGQKLLTGGGIASGLEEALELIRLVKGEDVAAGARLTTQFFPKAVPSTIPSDPQGCPLGPAKP
jgi:transcriptional regulator GlxA family with amidase domain